MKRTGLIDGKISPLPNCALFFFRVKSINANGKTHSFDTCVYQHRTLDGAFQSIRSIYPGAEISALHESDFDMDGLPKVHVRAHAKDA